MEEGEWRKGEWKIVMEYGCIEYVGKVEVKVEKL